MDERSLRTLKGIIESREISLLAIVIVIFGPAVCQKTGNIGNVCPPLSKSNRWFPEGIVMTLFITAMPQGGHKIVDSIGSISVCTEANHKRLTLKIIAVYDIKNDELYEFGQDAYQFLLRCSQGEKPIVRKEDEEFLQYCLSENLIHWSTTPLQKKQFVHQSPIPSLRYLELLLTDRCNLRCRHCYVGDGLHQDLPVEKIFTVLKEFGEMEGLRLLLSGGEPLLHPHFWKMNEVLREYSFRSVLLSNGTLITREAARKLLVHEAQLSLDGCNPGSTVIAGGACLFVQTCRHSRHLSE